MCCNIYIYNAQINGILQRSILFEYNMKCPYKNNMILKIPGNILSNILLDILFIRKRTFLNLVTKRMKII